MAILVPEQWEENFRRLVESIWLDDGHALRTYVHGSPPSGPFAIFGPAQASVFINHIFPDDEGDTLINRVSSNPTTQNDPSRLPWNTHLSAPIRTGAGQLLSQQFGDRAPTGRRTEEGGSFLGQTEEDPADARRRIKQYRKEMFMDIARRYNVAEALPLGRRAPILAQLIPYFQQRRQHFVELLSETGTSQLEAMGGVPPSLRKFLNDKT